MTSPKCVSDQTTFHHAVKPTVIEIKSSSDSTHLPTTTTSPSCTSDEYFIQSTNSSSGLTVRSPSNYNLRAQSAGHTTGESEDEDDVEERRSLKDLDQFHSFEEEYPEDNIPDDWTEPVEPIPSRDASPVKSPVKFCTPVQDDYEPEEFEYHDEHVHQPQRGSSEDEDDDDDDDIGPVKFCTPGLPTNSIPFC